MRATKSANAGAGIIGNFCFGRLFRVLADRF
jgi:hypothetical protein